MTILTPIPDVEADEARTMFDMEEEYGPNAEDRPTGPPVRWGRAREAAVLRRLSPEMGLKLAWLGSPVQENSGTLQ